MTVARNDSTLRSWGRAHGGDFRVTRPSFLDELPTALGSEPHLAIGARRSYGDSGLSTDGLLVDMTGLDRIIGFDPTTGLLTAEAGVQLADIMAIFVPQGWFVPVTPGTRFVTLGGAVANDVHGKNHHRAGSFGCHVTGLRLARSDAPTRQLLPGDPLFAATVGGLGLTGVMEAVSLRLQPIRSAFLEVETIPISGLDDFFAISLDSETFEHTVAWIDCTASGAALGRGVFSRADWLDDGRLTPHADGGPSVPLDAPSWALNPLTLKAFNLLYRARECTRPKVREAHYTEVFHPLDAVSGWNRLYGPNGFYQFQCVIPSGAGQAPVRRLLEIVAASGEGSTLAVLKRFGEAQSPGLLSFCMPGITLALDFANRGAVTIELLARLDAVVADAGGRLYAAKDGRASRAMWRSGYPNLESFLTHRDPACRSDFSRRMEL